MGCALLLAANRRLSLREVTLVCVASALALEHRRMLFLFGLLTAPVLSHYGWGKERRRANPLASALVIFGCLAAIVWLFPGKTKLEAQVEDRNPVAAVRYIRQAHPAGRMLNEYRFGGYLIWAIGETARLERPGLVRALPFRCFANAQTLRRSLGHAEMRPAVYAASPAPLKL